MSVFSGGFFVIIEVNPIPLPSHTHALSLLWVAWRSAMLLLSPGCTAVQQHSDAVGSLFWSKVLGWIRRSETVLWYQQRSVITESIQIGFTASGCFLFPLTVDGNTDTEPESCCRRCCRTGSCVGVVIRGSNGPQPYQTLLSLLFMFTLPYLTLCYIPISSETVHLLGL